MPQFTMANICNDLDQCAKHLNSGNLVAFPTETVYGLGASALNESAVLKIFEAKKRPLTDPVIVHVSSLQEALALTSETDPSIIELLSFLGTRYWPGPLTLVVKSGPLISPVLTANTDYVGLRCPNHPTALALISAAGVPIAAPSANLFSHVSPTTAAHVLNDFRDSDFDIKVIDGNKCAFGIESTVAKVLRDNEGIKVIVLRRGGVSEEELIRSLGSRARVEVKQNYSGVDVSSEAPGQLLKHYSPNIETYLLDSGEIGEELCHIEEAVFLNFNKSVIECKAEAYLSGAGNVEEAINNLYEKLRWAESEGGRVIILAIKGLSGPHAAALWDRITRATSGRAVVVSNNKIYLKAI